MSSFTMTYSSSSRGSMNIASRVVRPVLVTQQDRRVDARHAVSAKALFEQAARGKPSFVRDEPGLESL